MLQYRKISVLALCAACASATLSAAEIEVAEVEVILEPATTTIRAEDPLFIKVRIANRSGRPVSYNHPLNPYSSTIWFESRRVGEAEFKRFTIPFQIISCALGVWRTIEDGDELVAHAVISRKEREASPFAEPGDYELRSSLFNVQGIEGTSKPVTISVTPIPPDERQAIVNAARRGLIFGPSGVPDHFGRLELAALRDKLTPSIILSTLDWLIALVDMREADTPDEFERAKAQFARLRRKMDEPTRECAKLELIQTYIQTKRFDKAWYELLALKFNGYKKERLWNSFIHRAVIDNMRRENTPQKTEKGT